MKIAFTILTNITKFSDANLTENVEMVLSPGNSSILFPVGRHKEFTATNLAK